MKTLSLLALTTLISAPAFADETRQLDSHEHGVGQLDIAIENGQIVMEFHAPGADIVGFEYAAETDEDRATVDAALSVLANPLEIFAMPEAAQCKVIDARAELESEGSHEDHDNHADDEDGHDDHGDGDHDHDDHDHGHGHEDHDEHAQDAGHTEFHAEYQLECSDISALSEISFPYFTAFPNALEVEVQIISDDGARAFEVERDAPLLDLSDLN